MGLGALSGRSSQGSVADIYLNALLDLRECVQCTPKRVKSHAGRADTSVHMPKPSRKAPMLKLLIRNLTTVFVLLLAFAAPSALAAKDSHRATSHAAGHRTNQRRNGAHRRFHKSRAGRLVSTPTAAVVSSTSLLGESTLKSHMDYVIAGQAETFRFQASSSALAGIAHVYVDSHNAARTSDRLGLYSDASGHPGTLLSSGSISAVQLATWNSVALTPVALVSGDTYWLAVLGEQGTLRYRDREKGPCPSAPIFAVAYWASVHSAQFGARMPNPVACSIPISSSPSARASTTSAATQA